MWFSLVTPEDAAHPGDDMSDGSRRDPFRDWSVGTLIMTLFLTSLGILFAASTLIYLIMRARAEQWPPPGAPELPAILWVSTGIILLSSVTIHLALRAIRNNAPGLMRAMLVITTLLAVAFVGSQVAAWYNTEHVHLTTPAAGEIKAYETSPEMQLRFYVMLFWFLTILHGAHVVGGIVPLIITTRQAFIGRYTPKYHPGLSYTTMYWHFLDVVWLILFAVLYLF